MLTKAGEELTAEQRATWTLRQLELGEADTCWASSAREWERATPDGRRAHNGVPDEARPALPARAVRRALRRDPRRSLMAETLVDEEEKVDKKIRCADPECSEELPRVGYCHRHRCQLSTPDGHCRDAGEACGFCSHHCELHHAPSAGGYERPDFRRGEVLVCDLPWMDADDRWEFHHWEVDVAPKAAGQGVGEGDAFPWPRDYCGMSARVFLVESEAKSGKTTSRANSVPAESLRRAGEAGAGEKIGGGKGRVIRVCCVVGCGSSYAGTVEPERAEAAGLEIAPTRAGKVPLCRKHRDLLG